MKNFILISCLIVCAFVACSPKLSPDNSWKDKKWVLVELKQVPVQLSGTNRDAHLFFSPSDKKIIGSGGCNRINGSYEIEKKNDIRFKDIASTRMSCPDINFETTFLNTLKVIDHYSIRNNIMTLKDGNETVMKLKYEN